MDTALPAELVGLCGACEGRSFKLGQEPVLIGRGSACTIVVLDPRVSREHAEIRWQADGFIITDLASTHGTWVDGVRVQQAHLAGGARLRLGDSDFELRILQDAIPTLLVPGEGLPASTPPPAESAPPPQPDPIPVSGSPTAVTQADQVPKPAPAQRGRSKLLFGCGALLILAVVLCLGVTLLVALFYPGGLTAAANRVLGRSTVGYSDADLALALSVQPMDERAQVLESLGRPDEFDIAVIDVEGGQVRRESWYYYGFGTRIDFVDGTIIWTIDLEPAVAGTVFPAWYDPTVFTSGMSIEAASSAAAAASPASTVPEAIGLSEGGEDLAGGMLLAGDQITLAFQDGGLVYVETVGVTVGVDR